MATTKKGTGASNLFGPHFFERLWEESFTYIRTVVDVVREPVLILSEDFRVMAANESFYQMFKVEPKDTEGKNVYDLGNGQWNIPALRKLLEDVLPKDTFFKGFEVVHKFPSIGVKSMILNARQIHFSGETVKEKFPPIILLAIEDTTEMMAVAGMLASHTKKFEARLTKQTEKLADQVKKLQEELSKIKKKK